MPDKPLNGKQILITGGTGSLGKSLIRRLLSFEMGEPTFITIFSRDEGKQHQLRVSYQIGDAALRHKFDGLIRFRIGDVRDQSSLMPAIMQSHVVINAAALKQVPACEYDPAEAVKTNVLGAMNIVGCIAEHNTNIETVVCISTDKAAKAVNVMGMTKALQERIFLQASMLCPNTRFLGVRYGNVLASRGSVIPLFHDLIRAGEPLTITDPRMTRFLLCLDDSVDLIFDAIRHGNTGDLFVPQASSAYVLDIAKVLTGDSKYSIVETGIRPGEKLHEIMISEDEARRAFRRGSHFVIPSNLPEIHDPASVNGLEKLNSEYSSADNVISQGELRALLEKNSLLVKNLSYKNDEELIR